MKDDADPADEAEPSADQSGEAEPSADPSGEAGSAANNAALSWVGEIVGLRNGWIQVRALTNPKP